MYHTLDIMIRVIEKMYYISIVSNSINAIHIFLLANNLNHAMRCEFTETRKHFLLKGVMYQGIHTLLDFYIYDWKGVKNEGRVFQALVLLS